MKPAIDVADLKVSYGEQTILDGITMQVAPGEVAIVLGGSGCGKSTLLKTIIGLVEPVAGKVSLFGEAREEEGPPPALKRVGVMFQYGALFNSITVGENVALPLEMHTDLGAGLIEDVVRTRLHLVGLDQAYDLFPNELSGGMRKRAALARAMALDPEILFCDEPGAGLDPLTAAEIDNLLLTLNGSLGTTLVIVTHELLSIERMDGKLIMLDDGRVVFTGSVAEAKVSELPAVSRFFHPGRARS